MEVLAYIRYVIVNFIKRLGPMRDMFFSSKGRMNRKNFWIAFLCTAAFIVLGNTLLRALNNSMAAFYIALFFPFIAVYMLYCVYGKRLHDMGYTVRPFFLMVFFELVAVIAVMLIFGGSDYFAEFSQFERKEAIDPAVTQEIISRYQATIQANMGIIRPLLMAVPAIFTIWIGFAKTREK